MKNDFDFLAILFALVFPMAAASLYFVALEDEVTSNANGNIVQVAYGLSKVIQFAFPVCYLLLRDRTFLRTFRLSTRGLTLGAMFGLAVAIVVVAIGQTFLPTWLPDLSVQVRRKMVQFGAATPGNFIALTAFLCILHSFLEEYYWRWFVYGRLRTLPLGFTAASIVSAVGFTLHHVLVLEQFLPGHFWDAVLPFSLGIAIGGFVWAWLFERTGSIASPWISHLIVDVGIMYVGYRQVFAA